MKLLINASNLHVGGCVQVAVSVIQEISAMPAEAEKIHVIASKVVSDNLLSVGACLAHFASFRIYNSNGISALWRTPSDMFLGYDAVYTLFGPLYILRRPKFSAVGFAQAWIIYPDNEAVRMMPFWTRMSEKFKYWLQTFFFARADLHVVELEHARQGLIKRKIGKPDAIRVVHNTLSSLYREPSSWQPVLLPKVEADIRLGFIGRNYPHKNTAIFPFVSSSLKNRYGINAVFYVTFTENEWRTCSSEFRACAVNVGPLSVTQCPSFYNLVDGVVFPSLLECFSVTPLEAMAMQRPLFASDRAFVRDVCGPHAYYFDPMNPDAIADCIAGYFNVVQDRSESLANARNHAFGFSNPRDRAERYLGCVRDALYASNDH